MEQKNWFEIHGSDADIAVSTRIRLARNVANIPFGSRQSAEKAQYVAAKTLAKAQKNMGYVMLK